MESCKIIWNPRKNYEKLSQHHLLPLRTHLLTGSCLAAACQLVGRKGGCSARYGPCVDCSACFHLLQLYECIHFLNTCAYILSLVFLVYVQHSFQQAAATPTPSVHPIVHLSLLPTVCSSDHLSIHPSALPSVCPTVTPTVRPGEAEGYLIWEMSPPRMLC